MTTGSKRLDERYRRREFDLTRALREQVDGLGMNPSLALETLASIVAERAWEPLGYDSFATWMRAPLGECGLGWDDDRMHKLLSFAHPLEEHEPFSERIPAMRRFITAALDRDLAHGGPRQGQGNNITLLRGTSPGYSRARLKRDRPDLYEKVLAGELSANAAMIEAGFRRKTITVPTDVEGLARALHKHLTPEERAELARQLKRTLRG